MKLTMTEFNHMKKEYDLPQNLELIDVAWIWVQYNKSELYKLALEERFRYPQTMDDYIVYITIHTLLDKYFEEFLY